MSGKRIKKKPYIIAVDGPAASGKGTLARRLAEHLGLYYLDTGKLYRLVGKRLLESGDDITAAEDPLSKEAQDAVNFAENLDYSTLDMTGLSDEEVGRAASIVSALPGVRKALLAFQRDMAGHPEGAVLDGRDIGTVVCPEADLKLFITASLEARAKRRYKELQKQDNTVIYASVLKDLEARDKRDSKRKISPLIPAEGAVVIDTTDMEMEEVFQKALSYVM